MNKNINNQEQDIEVNDLLKILLSDINTKEFTSESKYDVINTYIYGEKFTSSPKYISSFSIKKFVNSDGTEFAKYKIVLKIKQDNGKFRFFSSEYYIGYNTKVFFEENADKDIKLNFLPVEWLDKLEVREMRKKDGTGKAFFRADLLDIDELKFE